MKLQCPTHRLIVDLASHSFGMACRSRKTVLQPPRLALRAGVDHPVFHHGRFGLDGVENGIRGYSCQACPAALFCPTDIQCLLVWSLLWPAASGMGVRGDHRFVVVDIGHCACFFQDKQAGGLAPGSIPGLGSICFGTQRRHLVAEPGACRCRRVKVVHRLAEN